MKISVVKRDGSTEAFSVEKIERVAMAAGTTPEQAKAISESVMSWIEKENLTSLSSIQIRDKVLEELKATDQYAADLFAWYQTTKDTK